MHVDGVNHDEVAIHINIGVAGTTIKSPLVVHKFSVDATAHEHPPPCRQGQDVC